MIRRWRICILKWYVSGLQHNHETIFLVLHLLICLTCFVVLMQEKVVGTNYHLNISAKDAYRSYLLAYNSHSMKDVFNVRRLNMQVPYAFGSILLHLVHCAGSHFHFFSHQVNGPNQQLMTHEGFGSSLSPTFCFQFQFHKLSLWTRSPQYAYNFLQGRIWFCWVGFTIHFYSDRL